MVIVAVYLLPMAPNYKIFYEIHLEKVRVHRKLMDFYGFWSTFRGIWNMDLNSTENLSSNKFYSTIIIIDVMVSDFFENIHKTHKEHLLFCQIID